MFGSCATARRSRIAQQDGAPCCTNISPARRHAMAPPPRRRRRDARRCSCTSSRNASPRISKLANWSNDAQAGDSSTTGARGARLARPRPRRRRRASSVPAMTCATLPASVAANSCRRRADQIRLADTGKIAPATRCRRLLGLPPAIQKMSSKHASARAAESALVALESLMNSTGPCGRPAPSGAAAREMCGARPAIACRIEAERQRGGSRARGVLRVVGAA